MKHCFSILLLLVLGLGGEACYCFATRASKDILIFDASLKRVKLNPNIPFESQVTQEKTIYVISDLFELGDKRITLPNGCFLLFNDGLLTNGILTGDFTIINKDTRNPVFKNVKLHGFKRPISITWFVGERKILYNTDFSFITDSAIIDFENIPFTTGEMISISNSIKSLSFENLKVNSSFPIRRWMASEITGKCWNVDKDKVFSDNVIWTEEVLPMDYLGYLIRIETADIVKFDDRDLSLFKGVLSIITNIDGHKVSISDCIEPFSTSRNYTLKRKKEKKESSYKIYSPVSMNVNNCDFTFIDNTACLTIDVYNSIIQNSVFKATKGSAVLFNVTGHSISIHDCTFKDAWSYTDNDVDMAYGIQVNEGTNVRISKCVFQNNRRSVDFSGRIESRYCEVAGCTVYQDDYICSGSALGGHSTSYGNVYKNNEIYGLYSAGIQCRGEKEQVIGNKFYCRATGAVITTGVDTKVVDNQVLSENKYETDCFIYSTVDVPGNTLVVENNNIRCRQQVVNILSKKTDVTFKNNTVNLYTNSSSNQTFVFKYPPKVYLDNDIKTNSTKKVKLIEFKK